MNTWNSVLLQRFRLSISFHVQGIYNLSTMLINIHSYLR